MNTTKLQALIDLKTLCDKHDWFYHYSDDYSVYRKGESHWKSIKDQSDKCLTAGCTQVEIQNIIDESFNKSQNF